MVNPEDIKVCVYTICKNEEMFAERWLMSAEEADGIFVSDTGSTDNTISILESNPKVTLIEGKIRGENFRFDYAWNEVLSIIPDTYDFCVRLDMDMMLTCGWCKQFKRITASILNSGFFQPAIENISFGILQFDIFNKENIFKRQMWNVLAHSYSKSAKYFGAVHEDFVFNDFKGIKNLGIQPKTFAIFHTEVKKDTKNDFYSKLGIKRFKECPTYLNYLLYLGTNQENFLNILSQIDNVLNEVSTSANEALLRFESSINVKVINKTGRLYLLYLKLLKNVFLDKNKEEAKRTLLEIKNSRNLICEASRKEYFNVCARQFFIEVFEEKYDEKIQKIIDNILEKTTIYLYDYIVETFTDYLK